MAGTINPTRITTPTPSFGKNIRPTLDNNSDSIYPILCPHSSFNMLQGTELLSKIRTMSAFSRSDLVRACGYVTITDGKERLNYTSFYEAVLKAKGVELKPKKRMGRKLTHKTKIQPDGKAIVGSAYLQEMNLKPGTSLDIKVGRNSVVLTAAVD